MLSYRISKVIMIIDSANPNLIALFNDRSKEALGEVYSMLYTELHYYAIGLYRETPIDPYDAIQDVFLSLWQSNVRFEALINLKAYLFIAVRNNFRKYISNIKTADKFRQYHLHEKEMFHIDVIESEVLSSLHHILRLLPDESAEILRLFFEGWNIDDIATKLGKTKRTIYNKKSEAIATLRDKLSPDELLILLLIFG